MSRRTADMGAAHLTYTAPHEGCRRCGESFINEPVGHLLSEAGGLEQVCEDCCPVCP